MEGIVNPLLHRVWWQGNYRDDVAFLKVVGKFYDQVAWIPLRTPLALIHLLLSRVGGAVMSVQVVDNDVRAGGGHVGS